MDEDGKVTGHMRKKISKLLHVGHLGEVKTVRDAQRRYYWPSMYHEVKQEVKYCEACRNNAKKQAPEPPPQKHEFAERPMQKISSDIFHFGNQNWLILADWVFGFSFAKCLGRTSGTEQVIHKMKKIFLQFGFPEELRTDFGPHFRDTFQKWCRRSEIRSAHTTHQQTLEQRNRFRT